MSLFLKKNAIFSALICLSLVTACSESVIDKTTAQVMPETSQQAEKPNIVLFFVDDLGWADLGYRNSAFESPNIDKLASESLDFQSTYIATPTCSPSRATLLTGQHPARLEFFRHIPTNAKGGADAHGHIDQKYHYWEKDPAHIPSINWLATEYTTYAEALKEQGYYNAFFGKWHVGHEGFHPIDQGFDQQIGTTNWGNPKSYNAPFFKPGTPAYADINQGYLTDKLTDDAVNFIETYDQKKPFMLSFWYYSVHSPHHGRPDLVKHFEAQGLTGKAAHYAAMVKSVDMSVGRVRATLKAQGLSDNTIILFLSDQGGAFQNGKFRGGKYSGALYEGGSRVPFLVNWPGVTKAGTSNDSLIQSTDLFPTLVEIAGGDVKKYQNLDGVSLLPTIKNNSVLARGEPLIGYRAYEDLYATVRLDAWKLIAFRSGKTELYNIANDVSEEHDVAKQHPEKVKELVARLATWEKTMHVDQYSGIQ